MSSNFNMHAIKRQARKEAWYGDSYNPFGRTTRTQTWSGSPAVGTDPELGLGRGPSRGPEGTSPLSNVATEPIPESPSRDLNKNRDNEIHSDARNEDSEMTKAGGSAGRPSDPESEATIMERASTRPRSEEEKARHRFLGKFRKGNKESRDPEEVKEKKTPWYKGKEVPHQPFTVRNQLQRTIFGSWVNVLLIAAPVGIGLKYAGVNGRIIFVVNFIAIIPLAGLLSYATEEIALHLGESLGGLLNASFGNAVEIIVAVLALIKGEVVVVQTSLIGSMLSNLLLVMGMCFFFGGLRRREQYFNQTIAQTAASMLALAIGSVIIPTAFNNFSTTSTSKIAQLSRGTAIILLVVYAGYLYFQLSTHSEMFAEESKKVAMRPRKHALPEGAIAKGLAKTGGFAAGPGRAQLEERPPNDELLNFTAHEDAEDEPEQAQLHIMVSWATLAGSTAIIGLCSEFMVDGIGSITESGVSVEFVGLILLPIVGNAAEHATAVTVACKDKMDLAIGVAVGSSMQIALLVIPLLVVIGWCLDNNCMNMSFDGFQVAVLFVAVLLVNYLIGDGKSHWLEGLLLQCLYVIIAVSAWYYPANDNNTKCNQQS